MSTTILAFAGGFVVGAWIIGLVFAVMKSEEKTTECIENREKEIAEYKQKIKEYSETIMNQSHEIGRLRRIISDMEDDGR